MDSRPLALKTTTLIFAKLIIYVWWVTMCEVSQNGRIV